MHSVLVKEIFPGVARIQINRPRKCNAINFEVFNGLRDALKEFETCRSLKVAVLGGRGGSFCSGYDLVELVDPETAMPRIQQIERMLLPLGARLSNSKPIIAAIDGYALGFGLELALRCDFRVGENDAKFGFTNRRFGIPIMNGGTVILPQLIGHSQAINMIGFGISHSAVAVDRAGILSNITDVGCAWGKALNLARCLAKFEQTALIGDLKSASSWQTNLMERFKQERHDALEFLRQSGPLDVAKKFLEGELCRHGETNLGNLPGDDAKVSL